MKSFQKSGEVGLDNIKNVIVDGRFDFWFEGVSQTSSGYGSDTMWLNTNVGSTKVHTQESLVPGVDLRDVPTAKFFSRTVVTSVGGASNFARKEQKIENVGSFAGKRITLSFDAEVDSNKNIAIEFNQNFGTGGSPSATVEGIGAQQVEILSGSLARYEVTVDIPSLSGKTLGTNGDDYLHLLFWFDAGSSFDSRTGTLGQQSGTFDIAAIQLEEGIKSTNFKEETAEVSRSRVDRHFRCYERLTGQQVIFLGTGMASSGTSTLTPVNLGTPMRGNPALAISSAAALIVMTNTGGGVASTSIGILSTREEHILLIVGVASGVFAGEASPLSVAVDENISLDSRL